MSTSWNALDADAIQTIAEAVATIVVDEVPDAATIETQCEAAITNAVAAGYIPGGTVNALASSVAAATAAIVAPTLQRHNGSFGVDVDFTFAAAPPVGNRLAIYGFIATGGTTQFTIEFRSGVGGNNTQFSPNPCIFTVGAGSSPSMTPGTQPLWYTANDKGLAVLKSSTQTCHLQVWWKVVPNL